MVVCRWPRRDIYVMREACGGGVSLAEEGESEGQYLMERIGGEESWRGHVLYRCE